MLPLGSATAAPTYVDPTFGDDGVAEVVDGGATAIAVQPDGRIVVGGWRRLSTVHLMARGCCRTGRSIPASETEASSSSP